MQYFTMTIKEQDMKICSYLCSVDQSGAKQQEAERRHATD